VIPALTWSVSNKVCVVTGANQGIGKATALGLAEQDATVAMVVRNRDAGERACHDIIEQTGNNRVQLHVADLASQVQIRNLAEDLKSTYAAIHVLINNAGIITQRRELTEDGIERQFAVNHLAYFLLTHLLLPQLKGSAPSRIINVASSSHHGSEINFDDLYGEKKYHRVAAYGQSKLANIMFTYELARRLDGTGVTVNALNPGVVNTLIYENYLGNFKFAKLVTRPFTASPEKGARTPLFLAASPKVEGITGRYFASEMETRSSAESYDRDAAARLWEVSEELTGLK
jgi:NAD(P)-dependent dehydrogenase (short-subunit alcohol dehydrogenase family)